MPTTCRNYAGHWRCNSKQTNLPCCSHGDWDLIGRKQALFSLTNTPSPAMIHVVKETY